MGTRGAPLATAAPTVVGAIAHSPHVAGVPWSRLLRVRDWGHFLLLPLAGAAAEGSPLTASVLRGVAIAAFVLSFGFLLNAVSDRSMDDSSAKNPLAARGSTPPRAWVLAALGGGAMLCAVGATPLVFAATATCLVSGTLYSIGPRLKAWPLVGTALNAGNFAPLLFVGLPGQTLPAGLTALSVAFVALLLQNQLLHESQDSREDRRGRLRTTFLVFGGRAAAVFMAALGALACAACATIHPWLGAAMLIPFGCAFPALMAKSGAEPIKPHWRLTQRYASLVVGAGAFALIVL